ncbi:MAG: hypothetical protein P8127_05020 [Acidobacteriota bacterium]
MVAGWYHAALFVVLPWVTWWRPSLAPVVAAAALAVHRSVDRRRVTEPWSSITVIASAAAFLLFEGGWEATFAWLLLAAVVVAVARTLRRQDLSRPDAADFLAIGGWALAFVLEPRLVAVENGGWLAPALLIFFVQRVARFSGKTLDHSRPGPPGRDVRGTLSLRDVVVPGADSLPRTVPINLDLRAGESIAILCDSPVEAAAFADVVVGRRRPLSGQIVIDGSPPTPDERVVALVAPGEAFVPGDLLTNISPLAEADLDRTAFGAISEACSLEEVGEALADRPLEVDGSPLTPNHRLLVQAARVIPSSYRILVVVDPMPWVNAVRGEIWRAAVVRASVGRTAIWLTPDRELASRANHVVEYRQGALRSARLSGDR